MAQCDTSPQDVSHALVPIIDHVYVHDKGQAHKMKKVRKRLYDTKLEALI